jgi:GH24 family phage-related lysozyme (muramidase)
MDLSKATTLIKQFEGLRLTSYQDQNGIWTIGYGATGKGIIESMTITEAHALDLLKHHIEEVAIGLEHILPPELSASECQFNALISFVFNIGIGNFMYHCAMFQKIKESQPLADIALEFDRWIYADHKVVDGLYKRREAEKALFLS